MTFIEFIKSKLSLNNSIGDLARDIMRDKEFPIEKPTQEIIDYLNFKTTGGVNKAFQQLLQEYEIHLLDSPINDAFEDVLESNFSVFQTENWRFYKKNFSVDKVYLIGKSTDIYKVYCENTKSGKAIYFDIKSNNDLNNSSFIDVDKIFIGDLTQQITVDEAINKLENCKYEASTKPNEIKLKELLDFLKTNTKNV